ncbi:hypothetical protein [Streptomyces sp. NPDC048442]|uniref:hypothetical protein n=1 Tax=Streptomyces sp. NPDC048442 TaxID=3154823 RepID=UPI003411FD88
MTATHLVVGAEIIEAVGADRAAIFQDQVTVFDCVECGTRGDVRREPAVAVLRTSGTLVHLGAAHHRCTPSRIHPHTPGALRPADTTDLIPRAVTLPGPHGMRPLLLLAYEEDVTLLSAPGTDLVLQFLLGEGLHQLSGLGRQAPASPGWQALLGPRNALEIRTPRDMLLRDGQMLAPSIWCDFVARDGGVTLLAGRLDRPAIYSPDPPFAAYQRAVRRGQLAGGFVPVLAGTRR